MGEENTEKNGSENTENKKTIDLQDLVIWK